MGHMTSLSLTFLICEMGSWTQATKVTHCDHTFQGQRDQDMRESTAPIA